MQSVVLHPFRFHHHLFHIERQQRDIELLGQRRVNCAERLSIAAAVVRRNADLHQQRLGAGLLHQGDDLAEIALQILRRETAQTIVGPQLDQHPARLVLFQQRRQARQALCRGIAADAGVDQLRFARFFLPLLGQQRRPGLRYRQAVAGA